MSEGPEASGSSQSMEGALPAHTPKEPLAAPADAVAVPPVPLNTQSPLPTSPDSTLDIPPERGAEVLPEATMDVDALPEASISVLPEASMGVVPEASMDVVPEASMDVIPEASMDVLPEASVDIPPVGDVDTVPEGSGDIPLEDSANIALEGSANIAPADPTSTATPGPTSPANPVPTVTTAPVSPSTARRASSLAEGDEVYPIPDSIHPIPEGDDAILTMDQIRWLGRFRPFPEPVRCSLTINNVACNAYMETADKLDRHMSIVHLPKFRAMSDEERSSLKIKFVNAFEFNTLNYIEEAIAEWVQWTADRFCPIANCPHYKVIKPEAHYKSLALHGTEPLTRKRLRPEIRFRPPNLDIKPIPESWTVPSYLLTCHEIQPYSGRSNGPRKSDPRNQYPIVPIRRGDPLLLSNGQGLPDETCSLSWSSDFFRPLDEIDSDDEEAANAAPETYGGGLMGQTRVAPSRGRGRSQSIVSDATFVPSSPAASLRVSRIPSLPVVAERRASPRSVPQTPLYQPQPHPLSQSSSTLMGPPQTPPPPSSPMPLSQPISSVSTPITRPSTPITGTSTPVGASQDPTPAEPAKDIDMGNGFFQLARPLRVPDWIGKPPKPTGNVSGSPIKVVPRTMLIREIPNPLQVAYQAYLAAEAERLKREREESSTEGSETDEETSTREGSTKRARYDSAATDATDAAEGSAPYSGLAAHHFDRPPGHTWFSRDRIKIAAGRYAESTTGRVCGAQFLMAYTRFVEAAEERLVHATEYGGWITMRTGLEEPPEEAMRAQELLLAAQRGGQEPAKEEVAKEEVAKEEPVKEESAKEELAKEEPAGEVRVKEERVEEERMEEERVEEERMEEKDVDEERMDDERPDDERMDERKDEPMGEEQMDNERVNDERMDNERVDDERMDNERVDEVSMADAPVAEEPAEQVPMDDVPMAEVSVAQDCAVDEPVEDRVAEEPVEDRAGEKVEERVVVEGPTEESADEANAVAETANAAVTAGDTEIEPKVTTTEKPAEESTPVETTADVKEVRAEGEDAAMDLEMP